MKWLLVFLLAVSLLPPAQAHAQSALPFYDQPTLIDVQKRSQISMPKMLDVGIRPYLTAAEKKKLAKVTLEIPLTYDLPGTEEDESGFPLGAYSYASTRKIVIPALTLKWIYDLSLAIAWLQINGCELDTAFEYVSMLKYRSNDEFPQHHYPSPLEALQIPADAVADPKVDELGLAFYNHARAFILAHELGHIYYQHTGNPPHISPEQSQHDESEADRFAVDVLSRSGTIPVGVLFLFMAMAHYSPNRWEFANEEAWNTFVKESSHPVTPERIYTLATTMEENIDTIVQFQPTKTGAANARQVVQFIIDKTVQIGQDLEDEEVQSAITLAAPSTRVQTLVPVCSNEVSPTQEPSNKDAFDGLYVGDYTRLIERDTVLPIRFVLTRDGDDVRGTFNFGLGTGSLTGKMDGNSLYFEWEWANVFGHGTFYAAEDGNSFDGEWGYGLSTDNGGRWKGERK